MKTNYIKLGVSVAIVVILTLFGVTYYQERITSRKPQAVLVTGLDKNAGKGFSQELIAAFNETDILHSGDALLKNGNIDGAIMKYEEALRMSKLSGSKAVAIISIANAYEKGRNYNKALEYIIIDRDKYVNDWAKEPVVERATYLKFALEGEYDLALKHAQKALEADAKLPNSPKGGGEDYIERLNDIKTAKDHILRLKKQ